MKSKLAGLVLSIGITLLAAGCGGSQNPYKLDTGTTHPVFNGMWDGFTVWLVFLKDIRSSADYQLYTHNASGFYALGYIIGIIFLVIFLSSVASLIRRLL